MRRSIVVVLLVLNFMVPAPPALPAPQAQVAQRADVSVRCVRFTLFRSSRAIRLPASWAWRFSRTGFQLDQSSRGPKRVSAQWRRNRLSIRVTERMDST